MAEAGGGFDAGLVPLDLNTSLGFESGVTAAFKTGDAGALNFGNYNGGAATTGSAPAPTLASAVNNPFLMLGIAFAAVLIFAPKRKKRGK